MAKTKQKPRPLQARDARGRFLPKTPLGEFNDSLNIGKEVGEFPNPGKEIQNKVNQITNITNQDAILALLRIQNHDLNKLLQIEETTQEQQKAIGNKQSQKQDMVVKEQSNIIALETHSNDILELINNGFIELLPHIKEIEKLTQLNVTYLNKLLDSVKLEGIKARSGLFNSGQKLLGYDGGSSGAGGGGGLGGLGGLLGGGLLDALGLGAAGYGAYKGMKAIRRLGSPKPNLPAEIPPEEIPIEELKFKGSSPHPEIKPPPEGLTGPEAPKGIEGPAVKEEEGLLTKAKNLLKFAGKKAATKEGAVVAGGLAGGPIGLLIDSLLMAISPSSTADAAEEEKTPGYGNRFDAPPKILKQEDLKNFPTQTIHPDTNKLKMLKQEDLKNFPKDEPIESVISAKRDPENQHGGIFHDWNYKSPALTATALHANVNPAEGGSATQMPDEAIAPFTPSKTFNEKAPQIIGRLKDDFGLTDVQAAGIVGNLGHESGGFKQLQEINPLGGGQGGYGWAQWTGPRRQEFMAWSKANNLDPASDEANYGFLKHELSNNYKGSIEAVKQTNNVGDATKSFEQTFERAGIVNMASRDKYSAAALNTLNTPTPGKSDSANKLLDAAKEKEKAEVASNQSQNPVVINAPSTVVGNQSAQQKGPMPAVRNDDPVLLTALKSDMHIT